MLPKKEGNLGTIKLRYGQPTNRTP